MGSEETVNNYNSSGGSDASNYDNESDASNSDDFSNADSTNYFRELNLRYFAARPLQMLNHHTMLKELYLEYGNPEAHYIEGLLHYFVHYDKHKGFYHLRQSAIGKNKNGIYLYGVLLLARGYYPKGKKYLDKLQWETKLSTSDHCWERIKNSVSGIHFPMNMGYYVNMVNLKPRRDGKCDCGDDMNKVCEECYYYKRLQLFSTFSIINRIISTDASNVSKFVSSRLFSFMFLFIGMFNFLCYKQ